MPQPQTTASNGTSPQNDTDIMDKWLESVGKLLEFVDDGYIQTCSIPIVPEELKNSRKQKKKKKRKKRNKREKRGLHAKGGINRTKIQRNQRRITSHGRSQITLLLVSLTSSREKRRIRGLLEALWESHMDIRRRNSSKLRVR
jgi:hypothetical protein